MGWLQPLRIVAGCVVVMLAIGAGCARRVDVEAAPRPLVGDDIQMHELRYSDAIETAPLINEVFDPAHTKLAIGEGLGRVHATADRRANAVVVTGPPELVKAAMRLIDALDEGGDGGIIFTYTLKHAQAADLEKPLRAILGDNGTAFFGDARRRGSTNDSQTRIAVVGVPATNSLLFVIDPRYEDSMKMVLRELDRPVAQVRVCVVVAEESGAVGAGDGSKAILDGEQARALLRDLTAQGRILERAELVGQDRHEMLIGGAASGTTGSEKTMALRLLPRCNSDGLVAMDVSVEVPELGALKVTVAVEGGQTVVLRSANPSTPATQAAGGNPARALREVIVLITPSFLAPFTRPADIRNAEPTPRAIQSAASQPTGK